MNDFEFGMNNLTLSGDFSLCRCLFSNGRYAAEVTKYLETC